jgi:hypothetical protein
VAEVATVRDCVDPARAYDRRDTRQQATAEELQEPEGLRVSAADAPLGGEGQERHIGILVAAMTVVVQRLEVRHGRSLNPRYIGCLGSFDRHAAEAWRALAP